MGSEEAAGKSGWCKHTGRANPVVLQCVFTMLSSLLSQPAPSRSWSAAMTQLSGCQVNATPCLLPLRIINIVFSLTHPPKNASPTIHLSFFSFCYLRCLMMFQDKDDIVRAQKFCDIKKENALEVSLLLSFKPNEVQLHINMFLCRRREMSLLAFNNLSWQRNRAKFF